MTDDLEFDPYLEHLWRCAEIEKRAADRMRLAACIERTQAKNPQHPKLPRAKELLGAWDIELAEWEIDKHLPLGQQYGQLH